MQKSIIKKDKNQEIYLKNNSKLINKQILHLTMDKKILEILEENLMIKLIYKYRINLNEVEKEEEVQQIYQLKLEEKIEQEGQAEEEHKIFKILEIEEEEVDLINKKDKQVFRKIKWIKSKIRQNIFLMIKINNFPIQFIFNHPLFHSKKSLEKMEKTI